jgi:hypothetical protein
MQPWAEMKRAEMPQWLKPLFGVRAEARTLQGRLPGMEKHFQDGSVELQIPPLRYAPVGMTKGRAALPFSMGLRMRGPQIPPLRSLFDEPAAKTV